MKFTSLQLTILNELKNGRFSNLDHMLPLCGNFEEHIHDSGSLYVEGYYNFENGIKANLITNPDFFQSNVVSILELLSFLENNGLIYLIPRNVNPTHVIPLYIRDPHDPKHIHPDYDIYEAIRHYYKTEVKLLPSFYDFCDKGFLTEEELERQAERSAREEAQRFTRKIAYFTISVTLLATLLQALFNYLTYSTEREVMIKNPGAFKDTIYVIISPSITQKDSSK